MDRRTISAHFELYALRDGRWVMDACFADEAEARNAAERTRRGHDVRGIRLIRELSLGGGQEPIATVLCDSTQDDGPLVLKKAAEPDAPPKPAPRKPPVARHAPAPHARLHLGDDDPRGRAVPATTLNGPWLVYAFGIAGIATVIGVGLLTVF